MRGSPRGVGDTAWWHMPIKALGSGEGTVRNSSSSSAVYKYLFQASLSYTRQSESNIPIALILAYMLNLLRPLPSSIGTRSFLVFLIVSVFPVSQASLEFTCSLG